MNDNIEVEWYSGKGLYTRPKRLCIKGVWYEVFQYEKRIVEDRKSKKRQTIFSCHIGDNLIVEVKIDH